MNIKLSYTLAELPSAQHRAGLAGLVLMVKEVHHQDLLDNYQDAMLKFLPPPNQSHDQSPDEYGLTLEFNLEGLKALFDLTYQAFNEPRKTTTKISKYDRIEEEPINEKGKEKIRQWYHYSVVVPQGAFLPYWDNSSNDENNGLWIKLWRNMIWDIVRDKDRSRTPFKERVTENHNYCQDTEKIWQSLQNPDKSSGQSGTYYLGATASTAENIPQKDITKYQFLLHFTPFTFQVYCPSILDKEGKRDHNKKSYAVIIPDVANLIDFCDQFEDILKSRSKEPARYPNYRPREALIDLPEEGALDILRLLRERIAQNAGSQSLEDLILGVEVIYAEKAGNNVKFHSISYVEPIVGKVDRYKEIQNLYWCPWFRKQRLLNLVKSEYDSEGNLIEILPWIGFDELLSRIPRKWFEDPYFSHDARQLFNIEILQNQGESIMNTESSTIRQYAKIVYKVCQSYVLRKLELKHELTWKKCQGCPQKEKEYNEKKTKIANEAFLAVRSRTESQSFIDYFVSTLYPFVTKEEFAQFADDLFNKTDEIRALTLLALSSQFSTSSKENIQETTV